MRFYAISFTWHAVVVVVVGVEVSPKGVTVVAVRIFHSGVRFESLREYSFS